MLPHYRVPFFRGLHAALQGHDIDLRVIYGDEVLGAVPKTVELDESWAHKVVNRHAAVRGTSIVMQPVWGHTRGADLVILEHSNRVLMNYALLAARKAGVRKRLAFWGHGRNFQASRSPHAFEALKRFVATKVDWWFAYTELSARELLTSGFPRDRITVVNNTIDISALERASAAVTAESLADVRARLNLDPGDPVAIFCAGLHRDKQIDFLIEACHVIRARLPRFRLLVIGDGPERHKIEAAAARSPWIHDLGPMFGPERALYFRLANAVLMPAHVGLVVIDSFVTGTPLIATRSRQHSPEIAYIEHGSNGVLTEDSVDGYGRAVADYLVDAALQRRLREGCAEAARRYTLGHMVERFATGVRTCLTETRGRRHG